MAQHALYTWGETRFGDVLRSQQEKSRRLYQKYDKSIHFKMHYAQSVVLGLKAQFFDVLYPDLKYYKQEFLTFIKHLT